MKQRTICLQPPPQPSLDASPDASRRPTGLCSIFLALALLLNLNSWADTPEEQGFAIATESDRRDQGWRDSTSELTMVLRNSHGEESVRSLRFRTLEVSDDGDKLMMIFDRPADVNGTVLLTYSHKTTSDDQWLFLPALKRVKRISSSNKSGPFIGSEFAYEDLASQEVEKYTYRYLRDEASGDVDCFVVERQPVDPKSGYGRQHVWIDKEEYRTRKVEYYDRKGEHLKTLNLHHYRQYLDRYWRAHEMDMENHQTGKSTQLSFKGFQFQTGLSERDFDRNSLKRAR